MLAESSLGALWSVSGRAMWTGEVHGDVLGAVCRGRAVELQGSQRLPPFGYAQARGAAVVAVRAVTSTARTYALSR